jgi:CubicO group peptidase (beta-lactamase class C family)
MIVRANRFRFTSVVISLVIGCYAPTILCQPVNKRDTARSRIDAFMRIISKRGQFSGAVLVGDADGILYEAAFGQANRAEAKSFTTKTPSCLASLSKPFTALAVMMQVQNGSMDLDQTISKYVDGLQKPIGAVTIRQLLTHTSGIPDYGNTPVDHPRATTEEVLQALRSVNHLEFPPGERYQYSNSGYVLLGAALARIAKTPFPHLLQTQIFAPAGMKQTFVFTSKGQKTSETAVGYNDFGGVDDYAGFVTGDGGIYSTVEDLYRLDRAFYSDTLISPTTRDEMFTPATVRRGTTTYGLGWNIVTTATGKRIWHTGNTAGFRAYLERQLANHRVIILLTNQGNSKRTEISAAINNILDGKPFVFPRRSGAVELEKVYRSSGVGSVLSAYRSLKQSSSQDYDLSETEINVLGYRILYADHNATDAVKVFAMNTDVYSASSNAFDSLAEAYRVMGDLKAAKANYERAVELDPTNEHARMALAQIK